MKIYQKVAVLIDGNNIELSIKNALSSSHIPKYDKLITKVVGERNLSRVMYYREGKSISKSFSNKLNKLFHGSVHPCKKSADVPIAMTAVKLASKVDTIVIFSGDQDYIDCVKLLKAEGVRVEMCAVRASTSKDLIKEVDAIHWINKTDTFQIEQTSATSGDETPSEDK